MGVRARLVVPGQGEDGPGDAVWLDGADDGGRADPGSWMIHRSAGCAAVQVADYVLQILDIFSHLLPALAYKKQFFQSLFPELPRIQFLIRNLEPALSIVIKG